MYCKLYPRERTLCWASHTQNRIPVNFQKLNVDLYCHLEYNLLTFLFILEDGVAFCSRERKTSHPNKTLHSFIRSNIIDFHTKVLFIDNALSIFNYKSIYTSIGLQPLLYKDRNFIERLALTQRGTDGHAVGCIGESIVSQKHSTSKSKLMKKTKKKHNNHPCLQLCI